MLKSVTFSMLHIFLSNNRAALESRCMLKVAQRSNINQDRAASKYGIPGFLSQVITTLALEKTSHPADARAVSGPAGGPSNHSDMGELATRHGRELSDHGYTIEQVVHDYGDLCQAITDLASELDQAIEVDEFRTLNRCLDNAIADAVNEFSQQRRIINDDKVEQVINQRLGALVHELRIHNDAARHAFRVIKSGQVGISGSTGYLLERSLDGMERIINRSFAEIRLATGLPANHELITISDFMADVKTAMAFEALSRKCNFTVSVVGIGLAVQADRHLLFSAVSNLLQNAFKFTHPGTRVTLTAYAEGDSVLIDIQDHCGGLGVGNKEDMFLPFRKIGTEKSGIGLGLAISRRSVEANKGVLSVRDIPGSGCVFTITLPKVELQEE